MSTATTCFCFGVALTSLWSVSFWNGHMFGIRRSDDPFRFWRGAVVLGMIALGMLIMPILEWTGLRT